MSAAGVCIDRILNDSRQGHVALGIELLVFTLLLLTVGSLSVLVAAGGGLYRVVAGVLLAGVGAVANAWGCWSRCCVERRPSPLPGRIVPKTSQARR